MATTTKYTFDAPTYEPPAGKKKNHRRIQSNNSEGEDGDPLDGSGSLTYSAASSINSAAGESTDSSFADIMRVLDVQDSKELAAVIQKARAKDERSVAAESQHSLAYSTDAESHLRSLATDGESALNGTRYLSTIPGYVKMSFLVDTIRCVSYPNSVSYSQSTQRSIFRCRRNPCGSSQGS